MVLISEWLPNPVGSDAEGEWLELYNDGNAAVSLSGWRILNGGGKGAKLGNLHVRPGEYLVLHRKDTKLVLRNRDETLSLYNAGGKLADRAEFLGSPPEGKSVSRVEDGFLITEPTPGAANVLPAAAVAAESYPAGAPLNRQLASADVIGLSLSLGALVAALTFFGIKRHDHLSQLFFGGNEKTGQDAGPEDKIPF